MLTFITGQPGNGKSLYVIALVEAMRKAESRPVFYYGIPDADAAVDAPGGSYDLA
nr:hypothetical protein [Ralstonia syzygii]